MSAEPPIVTLTSDFGDGSSYVAAMKGALLTVNGGARIVDLCHTLRPQDLDAAARFLPEVLPYLPRGTINVIVVDPGVGSERALLCVRWNGQYLLVPDNGCWTSLEPLSKEPVRVLRLNRPQYWRQSVSQTFHGRDILAPVAGHLSNGIAFDYLGEHTNTWQRLTLTRPHIEGETVCAEVVNVDHFGNLITNLPANMFRLGGRIRIGGAGVPRVVQAYSDAEPGSLIALINSGGHLEIAVVNGSAATRLGVGLGAAVTVVPP